MSSLARRSVLGLPLLLLACAAPASEEAESAGSADTGWVADTSFELGATISASVEQKAEGDWAEVATKEDVQVALVDAQWKYAKNRLHKAGYHLNQLADSVRVTNKEVANGIVKLTYEAKVDLIKELAANEQAPSLEQIQQKSIALKLPVRPIGAHAAAEGKCVDTTEGSPDGDSNFYYYFDVDAEGCALPTVAVDLKIVEVYPRQVVYPEYDKLVAEDLGGGKKGFRAAIVPAEGDSDPMSRFDAHKEMLEQELRLTGERVLEDKALRFNYTKGSVRIVLDVFDPTKNPLTPAFRSALKDYQLVFFNGHSIYGTRDLLTDETSFSDKYQIVMMHSCRSYPYYVRQVFRAKATDADPTGWAGADVVATGESSYPTDSPRTLRPLLEGLLDGMAKANDGTGADAPSWNAMVKSMNAKASGILYGVAGVRTNAWKPR